MTAHRPSTTSAPLVRRVPVGIAVAPVVLVLVVASVAASSLVAGPASAAAILERWPVVGPVLQTFDGGTSPYSSGHRGIDIGAAFGTPIVAPAPGTVAFAGPVGGQLFVSIDHPGGVRTTYSWLSDFVVRKGDVVAAGEAIGHTGTGHAGSAQAHLHFGVRIDGEYVDPLSLLPPLDVTTLIRLAPLA